ncbi:hypothetical protein V6C06_25030, partial (plasmid) [Vreelandella titanicae]
TGPAVSIPSNTRAKGTTPLCLSIPVSESGYLHPAICACRQFHAAAMASPAAQHSRMRHE